MIQSMTGFAEKVFRSGNLRLKFCIRSLNHRYWDWSYKGVPIGELENRLRAVCQTKTQRGKFDVLLEMSCSDPGNWVLAVNESLLEKILDSLKKVSRKTGQPLELSAESLFRIPQLIEIKRKEFTAEEILFLERSFETALDKVIQERSREGRVLTGQIKGHLRQIRLAAIRLEKTYRKQPRVLRSKLEQKLNNVGAAGPFSEGRMAEEVAYLSQKHDLEEEIVRLKSHLGAFQDLLSRKIQEPVGKRLDFLAQELSREANTLGSKSQDIGIINESLRIKGEVESIRQQVQNIE